MRRARAIKATDRLQEERNGESCAGKARATAARMTVLMLTKLGKETLTGLDHQAKDANALHDLLATLACHQSYDRLSTVASQPGVACFHSVAHVHCVWRPAIGPRSAPSPSPSPSPSASASAFFQASALRSDVSQHLYRGSRPDITLKRDSLLPLAWLAAY
ncbi:hypothetical protein AAL_04022 [Moelleriella libera RCEF 2490]|uniref:Uncharacterized protein n=1 Tax=Moelleriella libera RCEF 2490 TaxID=1081109 RepID=A0A162IQE3_9HYPO|nr:hypothetical protein AAL_04022 [Moelleriella libera RCEF 2490]